MRIFYSRNILFLHLNLVIKKNLFETFMFVIRSPKMLRHCSAYFYRLLIACKIGCLSERIVKALKHTRVAWCAHFCFIFGILMSSFILRSKCRKGLLFHLSCYTFQFTLPYILDYRILLLSSFQFYHELYTNILFYFL